MQDCRDSRLADEGVAGYSVEDILLAAYANHLCRDLPIDLVKSLGSLIYLVERMPLNTSGEAVYSRMAAGTKINGIGRGKKMPGLNGDQAGISGSETNNGDGHA